MRTALFLGRFQPPHVGHLLTINNLLTKYDIVKIGITEGLPRIIQPEIALEILTNLLPKDRVKVFLVKGVVEDGTAVINETYDVCVTGNPNVVKIMQQFGKEVAYQERSKDSIYTGTNERKNLIGAWNKKAKINVYQQKLLPLEKLKPIEKINKRHFNSLETAIFSEGMIRKPLIVDNLTGAVLDGSHRYAFFLKNGFTEAPCWVCDYDDESIQVGNHLVHRLEIDGTRWITKQHVRQTAVSGNLYEPRTTRHFFPFRKDDINIKLNIFAKQNEKNIEHLTAKINKSDELAMNVDYINELEEEQHLLQRYAEEQNEVKLWLINQNKAIANEN